MQKDSYSHFNLGGNILDRVSGLFPSDKEHFVELSDVKIHRDTNMSILISSTELGKNVYVPISQLRVDSNMGLWVSTFIYRQYV